MKSVFDKAFLYSLFILLLFVDDLEDYIYKRICDRSTTFPDELQNKINIYLKLFVLLYTDDTVLRAESVSELHTLLDKFYRHFTSWKMKINVDKTKMFFSRRRMPVNLKLNYNVKDIERAKDFNYLGIYFSRSGSFKTCKKITPGRESY